MNLTTLQFALLKNFLTINVRRNNAALKNATRNMRNFGFLRHRRNQKCFNMFLAKSEAERLHDPLQGLVDENLVRHRTVNHRFAKNHPKFGAEHMYWLTKKGAQLARNLTHLDKM